MRSPLADLVVAAGEDRLVAADDRRDLRVLRKRRHRAAGRPTTSGDAASSTSNSPTCTCPSAKTSVCRAAGTPRMRLIAYAVSSSEETTKSTSSWPFAPEVDVLDARRADDGRRASAASRRANMPATRFTSSREVHAMTRSAACDAGGGEVLPARPVALEHRDVEARRHAPAGATPRVSSTVISCSSWRASTMVEPTWPAPMRKTRTSA